MTSKHTKDTPVRRSIPLSRVRNSSEVEQTIKTKDFRTLASGWWVFTYTIETGDTTVGIKGPKGDGEAGTISVLVIDLWIVIIVVVSEETKNKKQKSISDKGLDIVVNRVRRTKMNTEYPRVTVSPPNNATPAQRDACMHALIM